MTYLHFHLVFLTPAIAGLCLWVCSKQAIPRPQRRGLLFIMVIAVAYTAPWDNYLVAQQVWRYGQERVLAVIGFVPVEEYLFFALQPLLTGLWVLGLRTTSVSKLTPGTEHSGTEQWIVRAVGGLAHVALGVAGIFLLQHPTTMYLGLILVWAAPMLLLQWMYGGPWLWTQRRRVALGVTVPTIYLCVADRLAIEWGIWHISQRYTVSTEIGGLPLEEALFFLITNVLVVQGLLLAVRELEGSWARSPLYRTWRRLHGRIQKAVTSR